MTQAEIENMFGINLMTQEEYESIPKIRGWVTRDKEGTCVIYKVKPRRYNDEMWCSAGDGCIVIDLDIFKDLKWEDDPIEVELMIRKV
jgi:hypothetical protein